MYLLFLILWFHERDKKRKKEVEGVEGVERVKVYEALIVMSGIMRSASGPIYTYICMCMYIHTTHPHTHPHTRTHAPTHPRTHPHNTHICRGRPPGSKGRV